MRITICIGSSCHLKGSRQVVEELQILVEQHNLKGRIELVGTFCMGNCTKGVCVKIDETQYSIKPEKTKDFFTKEVLTKLKQE